MGHLGDPSRGHTYERPIRLDWLPEHISPNPWEQPLEKDAWSDPRDDNHNFGMGVARAAQQLGLTAKIFAPNNTPQKKIDGLKAFGAEVDTSCENYETLQALQHFTKHYVLCNALLNT